MGYQQVAITTDAAGAGNARTEYIEGEILHVSIVYAGAGAGTNVIVSQLVPLIPILSILGANANGIWSPRAACVDQVAAGVYYDAGGLAPEQFRSRIYTCGPVNVAVNAAGAGAVITVLIVYKDYPSD